MGSVTFSDSYSVTTYGSTSQSIRVNYSESYNILTNQTTVSITSIEIKSNKTVSGPVVGSVTINGTTIKTLSGGYTNTASPSANSWATITNSGGGSVAVGHNANGTGSMTVGLTGGHSEGGKVVFGISWNGKPFGVRTPDSKSVSLTTHPRGSAISSCPSAVTTQGEFSLSVSRNSTAFYHKATLSVGGTAMYTSDAFATSMSCTIPRSWFSSYPSVASLAATVSVQTYSDSSCTTAIGSAATQSFTVTADAGMKPSVSAGWVCLAAYNTGAASGLLGFIKGYSQAEAAFDGSCVDMSDAVGASIASFSVTCQGAAVSESPYRTPVLTQNAMVCTVTDTRGRSASETFSVALMDYANPTLTDVSIFRCDSNGDPDEDGTNYSAGATLSFSSLNGQNACSFTAAHKAAGGSYGAASSLTSGTASIIGPISADLTYTVKISATDALGNTAEFYATIPTRKWAMHFRPNGTGVAFGKAAEDDDTLEISSDWAVKLGQPLPVASGGTGAASIADAVYPVGSIYLSVSSTDPGTLFGGTWTKIEDAFLLAAGQIYTAGDTGGAASHVHTTGNHTLTATEIPSHTHNVRGYWTVADRSGSYKAASYTRISSDSPASSYGTTPILEAGGGQPHNHGNTGSSGNMPPYLVVHIWKRTA